MKNIPLEYDLNKYGFPRDDVSPSEKLSERWMLRMGQAIYAMWLGDATAIGYSDTEYIAENRRYAEGTQSVERYRKMLFGKSADAKRNPNDVLWREGLANLDFEPIGVAPKFINVVMNMFEDMDFDIRTTAIDSKSLDKKDRKKWELWYKSVYKDDIRAINEAAGMEIIGMPQQMPESLEELEFFQQIGNFKIREEIAYEAALQELFDRCNFKEVKRKILKDFLVSGRACVRDRVNPVTQKVETEYCDIARTIISYSNKTYNNPDFAAVIKDYTVSDLAEVTDYSEDELRELARHYGGYSTNPEVGLFDQYNIVDDATGEFRWMSYVIPVLEWEKLSVDYKYHTKRTNTHGETYDYDEKWEGRKKPKIYDTEKKKTSETRIRTRYRGCWVIGTEKVFDTGYQYDIPRRTPDEAGSSFHFYRLHGKSMVDIMRPHVDQMTLSFLRLQGAIRHAAPAGLIIEYDSLKNISMNEKELKPFDLLQIGLTTGKWIYKATPLSGQLKPTSMPRPIMETKGGIGPFLQEQLQLFEFNRQQIQELTGLTPIAVGGQQPRETTLGEQQLSLASTTNAVKHYIIGFMELKRGVALNAIQRIKIVAKYNKKGYEVLTRSIGFGNAEVFKLGGDESSVDIGIDLVPSLSQQERQSVEQAAIASMQIGKSGGIGITYADYVAIIRMLNSGELRLAQTYLAFREAQLVKQQQAIAKQNILDNRETMLATEDAKAKKEAMNNEAKNEHTKLDRDLELRNKLETDTNKGGMELVKSAVATESV